MARPGMLEHLQTVWLRIVNPKSAAALESRVKFLESETKELRKEILALVKRFPGAGNASGKPEEANKATLRPKRWWPKHRAWLEATDGGRLKVGRKELPKGD